MATSREDRSLPTYYKGNMGAQTGTPSVFPLYITFLIFLLSSVGRAGGTNYTGAIPIKADKKWSLKLYKFHIFLFSSVGRARGC